LCGSLTGRGGRTGDGDVRGDGCDGGGVDGSWTFRLRDCGGFDLCLHATGGGGSGSGIVHLVILPWCRQIKCTVDLKVS
jgi:hypothetical protein